MLEKTACPSRAQLEDVMHGKLSVAEMERLAEHVESCPQCEGTLQTCRGEDTFTDLLRREAGKDAEPIDPALGALISRIQQQAGADSTCTLSASEGASLAGDERTQALPSAATAAISLDFLAPPQRADEIGRLGAYRVLKVLGKGGMGMVFLAHDPHLDRLAALKVMLPNLAAHESAKQRFLREARAAAKLKSDHIVTIYQVTEDRGVPFLAMEYLEGAPLDQLLSSGSKLTVADIVRIGREVASGLADAHASGFIHRDIKPGNIWLEGEPGASATGGRAKILDFGLAHAQDDIHITHVGTLVGTPAYMAPEQARGEKVDARADLFSLGCVLYRLCTGVLPFQAETTMGVLMALAVHEPPPPTQVNREIPPALSTLVMQLLAKDAAKRPASAREVLERLTAIEQGRPARAAKSRWPLALAGGLAAAVLALVGGLFYVALENRRIDSPSASFPALDPAWVKAVAAMPPELQVAAVKVELIKRNPRFDGELRHKVERGVVTELAFLVDEVTDISPVRALPGLVKLDVRGTGAWDKRNGRLGDLTPLQDLKLESLVCRLNKVSSLAPLTGMPLTHLDLYAVAVADLTPLKDMKLSYLDCSNCRVSDLTPLEHMDLDDLTIHATRVTDLTPLKKMQLRRLNCSFTNVRDLSPLRAMPLVALDMCATKVTDLTPLKGLPLQSLDLHWTRVSNLAPLANMPLHSLKCYGSEVADLAPLKRMPLKVLDCDLKAQRDAGLLRSIKTLQKINGKDAKQFWKEIDAGPKTR